MVDQYLVEASSIVPIYTREVGAKNDPIKLNEGCFNCTHLQTMDSKRYYRTVVIYDGLNPILGFTYSTNDKSHVNANKDLWLYRRPGEPNGSWWWEREHLDRMPTTHVRIVNYFDGIGPQHVNDTIDIADTLGEWDRNMGYERRMTETNIMQHDMFGLYGMYIDPVETLNNWNIWDGNNIAANVHHSGLIFPRHSYQNILSSRFGVETRGPVMKRLTAKNATKVNEPTATMNTAEMMEEVETAVEANQWMTRDPLADREYVPRQARGRLVEAAGGAQVTGRTRTRRIGG